MTIQPAILPVILHENGRPVSFCFEELEKYHGFSAPAGITMAIKVMEKALPLLSADGYIERRKIHFSTCFAGPGFKDAVEMMTRAISEDRYEHDADLAHDDKGYRGKFYFKVSYGAKTVELILRDGILPHEFFELLAKNETSNDEKLRIEELKKDLSDRLRLLDGRWVYRTLEEDAEDAKAASDNNPGC